MEGRKPQMSLVALGDRSCRVYREYDILYTYLIDRICNEDLDIGIKEYIRS